LLQTLNTFFLFLAAIVRKVSKRSIENFSVSFPVSAIGRILLDDSMTIGKLILAAGHPPATRGHAWAWAMGMAHATWNLFNSSKKGCGKQFSQISG
jgi:hypothetical protein